MKVRRERVYLGLDPGTSCGWAVIRVSDGKRIASGKWDLSERRHSGGGWRFLILRRYLFEIFAQFEVVAVGYEEVASHGKAGVAAAHVYGGVIAVIGSICEDFEPPIPYNGIPVGTMKRVATGKGTANKAAMIDAANERFGTDLDPEHPKPGAKKKTTQPKDSDEADALWCCEVVRYMVAIPPPK